MVGASWRFCAPQQDVHGAPWIGRDIPGSKGRLAYPALEIVCNWCGGSVNFELYWELEVMRKKKVYASAFTRIQIELVVRPVHNWPAALLSGA